MKTYDYIQSKVDILLSKLYNYKHYRTQSLYFESELQRIAERIEDMQRPKGISTDKVRTQNQTDHTKILNSIFSEQMEIEKEYYLTLAKMKEIDTIIELIQDDTIKDVARKRFVQNISWTNISKELNCDRGTLVYHIKKELSKII